METQEQKRIKYNRNTELRHLEPNDVYELGLILDDHDWWKKLMEIIPKQIDAQKSSADGELKWEEAVKKSGLKYNVDHIRLIENATKRSNDCGKLFTQTLIDEWGTSGRKNERPTVGVLLQLLVRANLFRAADFVATDFLGEPQPERPLDGPARRISLTLPDEVFDDIQDMINDSKFYPETEALNEFNRTKHSNNENNQDYYEKYKCTDKDVNMESENFPPKPPPRLGRTARLKKLEQNVQTNNFNSTKEVTNGTHSKGALATKTILESIVENDTISKEDSFTMPSNLVKQPASTINSNNTHSNSTDSNNKTMNTESTQLSEAIIPNLSLFTNFTAKTETAQTENNPNSPIARNDNSHDYNHTPPDLSALNLNGERSNYLDESPVSSDSEQNNSALSKEASLEDEDASFANDSKEDNDYDNSLPNLSIFGERSSNNDSSLTSVTGTSGENSFELSTNESISSASNDDNIPCLTALNQ